MQIFGRRTSMTDFTTTISAEDFTKREELATPLECEEGKHQQIYSKYTAEFSKKKKKRMGVGEVVGGSCSCSIFTLGVFLLLG